MGKGYDGDRQKKTSISVSWSSSKVRFWIMMIKMTSPWPGFHEGILENMAPVIFPIKLGRHQNSSNTHSIHKQGEVVLLLKCRFFRVAISTWNNQKTKLEKPETSPRDLLPIVVNL